MNNAPVWAPTGLAQSRSIQGVLPGNPANRINRSGNVTPLGPNVEVTLVHAEHSPEYVWKNPATNKDELHVGGEPGGFVIEFDNGFKLWHMGDAGVFGDMKLVGEMYRPDLVLMSIGGGQFVMNPADAAIGCARPDQGQGHDPHALPHQSLVAWHTSGVEQGAGRLDGEGDGDAARGRPWSLEHRAQNGRAQAQRSGAVRLEPNVLKLEVRV